MSPNFSYFSIFIKALGWRATDRQQQRKKSSGAANGLRSGLCDGRSKSINFSLCN